MAWILGLHPLPRWIVGTDVTPDRQALQSLRNDYLREHAAELPFRASLLTQGVHLPASLFPTDARVRSSTQNPPDFLTLAGWGVSERMKDIVEGVEPDVHQFVPVTIYLRNGKPTPKRYFAVVLGNLARDQIDDELTTLRRNPKGKIEPPDSSGNRGTIKVNRNETRDWHAWFSRDIYDKFTISDELHAAIRREKIPGIDFTYLSER